MESTAGRDNDDDIKLQKDERSKGVKVANAVKAKGYWIFLFVKLEMSCLEMDEQELLGI